MRSKLGVVLLWILVFVLGGIAGAVSHCLYVDHIKSAPPKGMRKTPEQILDEMALFLKLDAPQKDKLKSIFVESSGPFRELNVHYKELNAQSKALKNALNEKITNMLRDDQKSRFQEWIKKYSPPPRPAGPPPPR